MHLEKYEECARAFEAAYKLEPRDDTKESWDECLSKMNTDL